MNPLLIMALLSAASAAANYQGQKKVDNSRASALAEEARRRKVAGDAASASAQSTAQLLTSAAKDSGAKASEIEAQYAAHAPPPGALTTSPQLSGFTAPPRSTLTVGSDQRALDRSRADTTALANAKAGLNAFGDVMVDRQIQANRNKMDIDTQNTGVRNWSQYVLPAQLNHANYAGQNWSTLADALQVASAIYGPIGLASNNAASEAAVKAAMMKSYNAGIVAPTFAYGGL